MPYQAVLTLIPLLSHPRTSTHALHVHWRLKNHESTANSFCEERFVSKYIPTIGVDYGVKPLRLGAHEARAKRLCKHRRWLRNITHALARPALNTGSCV